MPDLKCSAKKCMYNNDSFCAKNQIAVEGLTTHEKKGTNCNSFEFMNREYNTEIATFNVDTHTDIWCDAVNCKHLESGKCHADEVAIGGTKATNSRETRCENFTNHD